MHRTAVAFSALVILTGCWTPPFVQWLPDSSGLVYITGDGTVIHYDVSTRKTRPVLRSAPSRVALSPNRVALSPNGKEIAVTVSRFTADEVQYQITIYDLSGKEVHKSEPAAVPFSENRDALAEYGYILWSPTGDHLLVCGSLPAVYDLKNRTWKILDEVFAPVLSDEYLGFSPCRPDGKGFLAARWDRHLQSSSNVVFVDWDGRITDLGLSPEAEVSSQSLLNQAGEEGARGGVRAYWKGGTATFELSDGHVRVDTLKGVIAYERNTEVEKRRRELERAEIHDSVRFGNGTFHLRYRSLNSYDEFQLELVEAMGGDVTVLDTGLRPDKGSDGTMGRMLFPSPDRKYVAAYSELDDGEKYLLIINEKGIVEAQLKHEHEEQMSERREKRVAEAVEGIPYSWVHHLQVHEGLKTLSVSSILEITDANLKHLRDIKELEGLQSLHLNLTNSPHVSDAGLAYLKVLNDLEELSIYGSKISDAGLVHLAGLSNLRQLSLDGSEITNSGLAHLAGLLNLRHLSLSRSDNITDAGLEQLKGLTNLQSLSLHWVPVTDAGLEHLEGLKGLQTLNLESCHKFTGRGLVHLKALANLHTLELRDTRVTDDGLESLEHLTALRSLHIHSPNTRGAFLKHLNGLGRLEELYVYVGQPDRGRIAEDLAIDVSHLKGLSNLESLQLYNIAVTDSRLEFTKYLTQLKTLRVTSPKLTGSCLEHIEDQPTWKCSVSADPVTYGLDHLSISVACISSSVFGI